MNVFIVSFSLGQARPIRIHSTPFEVTVWNATAWFIDDVIDTGPLG